MNNTKNPIFNPQWKSDTTHQHHHHHRHRREGFIFAVHRRFYATPAYFPIQCVSTSSINRWWFNTFYSSSTLCNICLLLSMLLFYCVLSVLSNIPTKIEFPLIFFLLAFQQCMSLIAKIFLSLFLFRFCSFFRFHFSCWISR